MEVIPRSIRVRGKVLFSLVVSAVGGLAWRAGVVVVWKKAIWAFRLRLHSGLRQRGEPLALFLLALEIVVGWDCCGFGDGAG